ncbi:MAG: V4R domain-containing protein [Thermoproteota archaeon]
MRSFDSRKKFISYRFRTKKLGVANKLHRLFIDKLKLKVIYEGRIISSGERIGYGILDVTEFAGSIEDITSAVYEAKILNSEDEFKVYEHKVKGLGVVPLQQPLMIGNFSEAVVFPEGMIEGTLEGIKREFKSAGEAFLYYMGKNGGIKFVDTYKKALLAVDTSTFLSLLLQLLVTTGMCSDAKLLKYDEKNGKTHLSFSELFECKNLRKEKPNSQYFRGFIAGVVSSLWQTEVKVEEVTCIATGSGFCQFLVTKEVQQA